MSTDASPLDLGEAAVVRRIIASLQAQRQALASAIVGKTTTPSDRTTAAPMPEPIWPPLLDALAACGAQRRAGTAPPPSDALDALVRQLQQESMELQDFVEKNLAALSVALTRHTRASADALYSTALTTAAPQPRSLGRG